MNVSFQMFLFVMMVANHSSFSFQRNLFLRTSTSVSINTYETTFGSDCNVRTRPNQRFSLNEENNHFSRRFRGNRRSEIHSRKSDDSETLDILTYLDSGDREDVKNMLAEGDDDQDNELILPLAAVAFVGLVFIGLSQNPLVAQTIENFVADPTTSLKTIVDSISSMGDVGVFYFAVTYIIAEVLAIPAIPLTASAGYLFGVQEGTTVVLLSGSIAAAVSFLIGRNLLRERVENILEEYPKFQAIDRVIGKEGFKIMVLLRLSPIFPFALSNYLYGVTSVGFWQYFFGTVVGFAPGTLAYVYTGTVGKALTLGGESSEPWYFYAGILLTAIVVLKNVADVATSLIESFDEEDDYL